MPTNDDLSQCFLIALHCCYLYLQGQETREHILISCPFTRIVWLHLKWPLRTDTFGQTSVVQWVKLILGFDRLLTLPPDAKHKFLLQAAIFLDHEWQLRNNNKLHLHLLDPLQAAIDINNRLLAQTTANRLPAQTTAWESLLPE